MLNESAFFHVFLTLAFYVISSIIQKKLRLSWFNPLLMSIVFIILTFTVSIFISLIIILIRTIISVNNTI